MSTNSTWLPLVTPEMDYNQTVTSSRTAPDISFQIVLAKAIWTYASPVILLSGLVGNCIAVVVLLRKSLRQSSTYCLLAALAVSDNMVLLTGLLRDWLSLITPHSGYRWFNTLLWLCKPVEIISFTAMYCSAWLIVAVSVDRYLAVCRPAQAQFMRTPTHACIVIATTAIVALIVALLFGFITSSKKCFYQGSSTHLTVLIDMSLYSLLPSLMLFILNGYILQKMVKRLNRRRSLRNVQPQQTETLYMLSHCNNRSNVHSSNVNVNTAQPNTHVFHSCQSNLIQQRKIHLSCVTITLSLTYLVTTLPNSILLIVLEMQPELMSLNIYVGQTFTMLLCYFNHAVNFYLYCLTAQQVRTELTALMRCKNI